MVGLWSMTIYLIVINNIFRLKTIDQLSLLGYLRPSIKRTWQLASLVPSVVWVLRQYCLRRRHRIHTAPMIFILSRGGDKDDSSSYSVFLLRKRSWWCVGLNDLSGWTPVNSYHAQARVYAFCISRIRL